MYGYQTRTTTQTATQARRLASRIGAELLQVRALYGSPSEAWIAQFTTEAEMYLAAGYLDNVRYGFERDDAVIFELIYTARDATGANDTPGRIPASCDLSGAKWFSYLTQNDTWWRLSPEQREDFRKKLPFQRSSAEEPRLAAGLRTVATKSFSEETLGLDRKVRTL